jgi:hypothetical protein
VLRVDQTVVGVDGDCFAASVASVLEVPLVEVPDLRGADWWAPLFGWASQRGLVVEAWSILPNRFRGAVVMLGPGPRGRGHACVGWADGQHVRLEHDPHPSRAGLLTVWEYVTFTPRAW